MVQLFSEFSRTMLLMPKFWLAWLAILLTFNCLTPIYFIRTLEGKMVLAAFIAGAMTQMAIFKHKGFIRLLGAAHLYWIPLVLWLSSGLNPESSINVFTYWILSVIVVNSISLIIDAVDVLRYLIGERTPTLRLKK